MDEERRALVRARVAKAERKLAAARADVVAGRFDDAGSRAYYAMFHAARAALAARGLQVKTHSGLAAVFAALGLDPPGCQQLRQEGARPILNALGQWTAEVHAKAPPKSPLGKALTYAIRQVGTCPLAQQLVTHALVADQYLELRGLLALRKSHGAGQTKTLRPYSGRTNGWSGVKRRRAMSHPAAVRTT